MPSIYDTIDQTVFCLTLLIAIPTAFGIHELVMLYLMDDGDDDPDGWT